MSKTKSIQFNCFSPPVMLATLIIESLAIIYTLWRYNMSVLARLITSSLFALALFQLCEYHVCTGFGISAEDWSRLGYLAITTLPALGLHMLYVIGGRPQRKLVAAAYTMMFGFMVYFLVYKAAFIGYQCTGNYVIFQIGKWPSIAYGCYYYGWLVTAMVLGGRWASALRKTGKKALTKVQMIRGLIVGYLVFLVPTALAYSVSPGARRGIPSIMCGFAVLFSLILTFYILPRGGIKSTAPEK